MTFLLLSLFLTSEAEELAAMSDDDKIAQLMIVGFSGTTVTGEVEELISKWRVGGMALFSRNVKSTDQVRRLTRGIRDLSKGAVPPFVAIDQEGGMVVRLRQGVTVLPGAMAMGATRSRTLAYLAGRAVGTDLQTLGISMNFAPVLDVNSNPQNPVIGTRSMGERPELVGELGRWFIRGQEEAGVISVAKHFPGHGDTQSDSHYGLPSLPHDLARLRKVELVPFVQAIKGGLGAIMTAHLALPKVAESPSLPATLSKRVNTDILRKELGFEGLLLTDGLEMRGIVEGEGIGQAAVKAMLSGADMVMVLWSQRDREDVFNALKVAVLQGVLTRARLDESIKRILRAKHSRGLYDRPLGVDAQAYQAQRVLHDQVADEIAERAVTLVRDRKGALPLRKKRVLFLGPEGVLAQSLQPQGTELMEVLPTREQRQKHAISAIAHSTEIDVIVAAAQNRYHMEVIRQVHDALPAVPMVLVSLGSPYYATMLPEADTFLCAYGDLPTSQKAVARVLKGERGTVGRLPVTIPGFARYGDGLVLGASAEGASASVDDGSAGGAALGASKKLALTPK